MGTAIEHPVPDRVKPSFVSFDIRALWRLTRSDTGGMLYKLYPYGNSGRQIVDIATEHVLRNKNCDCGRTVRDVLIY